MLDSGQYHLLLLFSYAPDLVVSVATLLHIVICGVISTLLVLYKYFRSALLAVNSL